MNLNNMNVLVIGGGGREHAIISRISKNKRIKKIYALPGNGGISELAECVKISAEDIPGIANFAKNNSIDFAIVTPDDPLALGAVDALESENIPCFGCNKNAALIESSKIFAKNLMKKYGIPTADYKVFDVLDEALTYAAKSDFPIVIKADGLAKGKGVTVAENFQQARDAIISCMKNKTFGSSGEKILIEECLKGAEVTVLTFTDGKTLIPMISSMDHKRAFDGNKGANTGGMGVIAPNPFYTPEIADYCMKNIFKPTIDAMNHENRKFKGCLYFGLMLTKDGAKVIEYNCRFGDPETQAILPLMESDLFEIMLAVNQEKLSEMQVKFSNKYSCCVIAASQNYPSSSPTGFEIDFGDANKIEGVEIFHSGTALKIQNNGEKVFVTSGGRVLAVNAVAEDLKTARSKAYEAIHEINFEGIRYRHDIGA